MNKNKAIKGCLWKQNTYYRYKMGDSLFLFCFFFFFCFLFFVCLLLFFCCCFFFCFSSIITKTRLYNVDLLKPHFYIVKLGFTGLYIFFHIFAQNKDCGLGEAVLTSTRYLCF